MEDSTNIYRLSLVVFTVLADQSVGRLFDVQLELDDGCTWAQQTCRSRRDSANGEPDGAEFEGENGTSAIASICALLRAEAWTRMERGAPQDEREHGNDEDNERGLRRCLALVEAPRHMERGVF